MVRANEMRQGPPGQDTFFCSIVCSRKSHSHKLQVNELVPVPHSIGLVRVDVTEMDYLRPGRTARDVEKRLTGVAGPTRGCALPTSHTKVQIPHLKSMNFRQSFVQPIVSKLTCEACCVVAWLSGWRLGHSAGSIGICTVASVVIIDVSCWGVLVMHTAYLFVGQPSSIETREV